MRVLPLITALLLLTATPLMAADQAARELDWPELMPKDEVYSLMETRAVTQYFPLSGKDAQKGTL